MTSLAKLDDSALIERTLAGQNECFDVLVNRHTVVVRRRITSMTPNAADRDDLVQETFLKAWRHLPSFQFKASFRTWITRIATNEALQQHRRRDGVAQTSVDLNDCSSQQESPFEALVRLEARKTIRTAMARLPEK